MRIGVDATPLRERAGGIRRYTHQLLCGLARKAPEIELVLFGSPSLDGLDAPESAAWDLLDYPGKRWVELFHVPRETERIDLFHGPNYFGPLLGRTPLVITVHDMTVFLQPKLHPTLRRIRHRAFLPALSRRAARILTDSDNTRRDVMRLLRVPSERIVVTRLAVEPRFRPVEDAAVLDRVRARYGLPDEFLLYLGALEPRKNLPALFRAQAELRERRAVPPLVLAGTGAPAYAASLRAEAAALGLTSDELHFLGHVDDYDLPALYSSCAVFLYPSRYEGFGLPPLEAMACGAPVVVSNGSSLGELYADCSMAVSPDGIAAVVARLLDDPVLRQEIAARGRAHAHSRSWETVIDETLDVYRDVLAAA